MSEANYRPVTAADVGKPVSVCRNGRWYDKAQNGADRLYIGQTPSGQFLTCNAVHEGVARWNTIGVRVEARAKLLNGVMALLGFNNTPTTATE